MLVGQDYAGNNFSPYLDGDGWHNGWLLDNGFGTNEYPREQYNAITHFAGSNHEFRYGIDAQQVEWLGDVERLTLYSAGGDNRFSSTARSGFINDFSQNPFGVPCDFTTGAFCIKQDYAADFLGERGSNDTHSENTALYVRDRMTLGEHVVINAGLRAEKQKHENDVNRVVMDSTDVSPRFSFAYDINAGGKQLLTAFVGRSYHQLPQEAINQYMQDEYNGYNGYERTLYIDCAFVDCTPFPGFRFPLPIGYTASLGRVTSGLQWDLVDAGILPWDGIDPYYKDEVILGYEVQVGRNWAFDSKLLWWEISNLVSSTTQLAEFEGRIDIFNLTANTDDIAGIMTALYNNAVNSDALCVGLPCETWLAQPSAIAQYVEPYRDYLAAQLQFNRRFADGWGLYTNITFAEVGGSSHGSVFNNTKDTYGENLEQVLLPAYITNYDNRQANRSVPVDCAADWTQYLGTPISLINRDGHPSFDRSVIAKATGWKVFNVADRQTFTLGGHFTYNTGSKWQRSEGAGGTQIDSLTFGIPASFGSGVTIGERSGRELDAYWWLNLSGAYGFPLGGKLTGEVRLEIQNVTDQQDQVGITGTGEIRALRRGFQSPRRYRVLGSVRF